MWPSSKCRACTRRWGISCDSSIATPRSSWPMRLARSGSRRSSSVLPGGEYRLDCGSEFGDVLLEHLQPLADERAPEVLGRIPEGGVLDGDELGEVGGPYAVLARVDEPQAAATETMRFGHLAGAVCREQLAVLHEDVEVGRPSGLHLDGPREVGQRAHREELAAVSQRTWLDKLRRHTEDVDRRARRD